MGNPFDLQAFRLFIAVNNDKNENSGANQRLPTQGLLIWLAILAAIIGLVMAQSGEIAPGQLSIASIDELITAAKQDRVDKAIIQSDPKGEKNGASFRAKSKSSL